MWRPSFNRNLFHPDRRDRPAPLCLLVRGSGSSGYPIDHVHPVNHAAEDGIVRGKLSQRAVAMHDEELTGCGLGSAFVSHRHYATAIGLIKRGASVYFVGKRCAASRLAASAVTSRITALNHKAVDHPVKDSPVVIPTLGQQLEILNCFGRIILQNLVLYTAQICFEDRR